MEEKNKRVSKILEVYFQRSEAILEFAATDQTEKLMDMLRWQKASFVNLCSILSQDVTVLTIQHVKKAHDLEEKITEAVKNHQLRLQRDLSSLEKERRSIRKFHSGATAPEHTFGRAV